MTRVIRKTNTTRKASPWQPLPAIKAKGISVKILPSSGQDEKPNAEIKVKVTVQARNLKVSPKSTSLEKRKGKDRIKVFFIIGRRKMCKSRAEQITTEKAEPSGKETKAWCLHRIYVR